MNFLAFKVFDLIIAELLRKVASLYAENNERVEKSNVEQICNLVEKLFVYFIVCLKFSFSYKASFFLHLP